MAQRPWLLPAAFILLGLIWGSSFLWIKIAVEEMDPATVVAYRISLGAVAMLVYVRLTGEKIPRKVSELAPMAALGLIATALPFFLITWGEQYIDSGTAAVLNSLTPIFSLILAGLILHTESVTLIRTIGLVTGFAGAALLASREFALRGDPLALFGVAAVTVAAISYAGGASVSKAMVHGTPRNVVAVATSPSGGPTSGSRPGDRRRRGASQTVDSIMPSCGWASSARSSPSCSSTSCLHLDATVTAMVTTSSRWSV